MDILLVILQVVLAITSVLLILFILLHRGRGGGLSDMFGGGMGSNLGASGVAEKNLNRITVTLAVIWLLTIVAMGIITRIQTVVVS
ncbi:preprotein translocase subunit SecG [Pseudoclavibacter helvolus]|uniref:preprotein translocase subunit SecG n=1 Tax=Pseudoclavibacter helvolus TaxID=255205 RepID=UPI003C70F9D3